jgi:hypothetical protein
VTRRYGVLGDVHGWQRVVMANSPIIENHEVQFPPLPLSSALLGHLHLGPREESVRRPIPCHRLHLDEDLWGIALQVEAFLSLRYSAQRQPFAALEVRYNILLG